MIIAISASFVTCCMSINTADFLCQCIVHVLGIILSFFCFFFVFLLVLFFFGFFLEALSDELSRPTDRFVYRSRDCVPNSGWTFVFFMEKN